MVLKRLIIFITLLILFWLGSVPLATAADCETVASGNWFDSAIWTNCNASFPTTGDTANVRSGHTVTLNDDLIGHDLLGIVVDAGGVLDTGGASRNLNNNSLTISGTFRIDQGGFAFDGTFAYVGPDSTLDFANTAGSFTFNPFNHVFWPFTDQPANVNVASGGLDLNNADRTIVGTFQTSGPVTNSGSLTIEGVLQINANGSIATAPNYDIDSTLRYNTGSAYNRFNEWGNTPAHVHISGDTEFYLEHSGAVAVARTINGNLTIDSGSSFYHDDNLTDANEDLHIAGNVQIDGLLRLASGTGNLKVGGNFIKGASGQFTNSGSFVYFNGGGSQTIQGALSGSSNRFARIGVVDNSTVTYVNNVGITNDLIVESGSVFQTGGTANFTQEINSASLLTCDGLCQFHDLTVRNMDAGGSNGSIQVTRNFNLPIASASFTAPGPGTPFTIAGDFWSNISSGTFDGNGGTVTFNGSSPQTIETNTNIAFSTIAVSSGASVTIPAGTTAVSLINDGQIVQTRDVNGVGDVTFLALGDYGGVILNNESGNDLGQTTIIISGNQPCDTADSTIRRCFEIAPANSSGLNAAVTFFWHQSELNGHTCTTVNAYHWSGSGWDSPLALDPTYGDSNGRDCAGLLQSLRAVGVSDFSAFVLSDDTPTAVSLANIGVNTAVSSGLFLILLLAVVGTAVALLIVRRQPDTSR